MSLSGSVGFQYEVWPLIEAAVQEVTNGRFPDPAIVEADGAEPVDARAALKLVLPKFFGFLQWASAASREVSIFGPSDSSMWT
ncbi:hypothetical protein NKI36_30680 [Mesorhizobium caraganae]|uniref:Uncharacterized protein n=1 Tax=Mesorhizobium caraganae TaxID=483206 RepID=A0ABV1ZAL9_9HYPH